MFNFLKKKTGDKPSKEDTQCDSSNAVVQTPKSAIDLTLELLQEAEVDSVLELTLPRLIKERDRKLAENRAEYSSLKGRLEELYARRKDVMEAAERAG